MLNIDSDGRPDCLDVGLVSQALDGLCIGLVLTNSAGRITWANRAAERVLGIEQGDYRGQPLGRLLKDPQLSAFWHATRDGDDTVAGDVSVHWPHPRELKAHISSCVDRSGQPIGRALLFCDVTDERAAQIKMSRELTDRLLDLAGNEDNGPEPSCGLTPRELRVLRHVGSGLGNQQIAERLKVSSSTVRSHLKHVYRKLGLTTRAEAVRYAVQHALA